MRIIVIVFLTLFLCVGCSVESKDSSSQKDDVAVKQSIGHANVEGNLVKELSFEDGKSGGGEITDNVNIYRITLEQVEKAEHILIDFTQRSEATIQDPQLIAPHFTVDVQDNPHTMSFTMSGVRAFDASDFTALKESDLIADAYWVVTHDDSAWQFVIVFNSPVQYKVRKYANPAQVVISALPLTEEEKDHAIHTIRTEAFPFGGKLANLEEMIFEEADISYLRESGTTFNTTESSFYMELGHYQSVKAAEEKMAQLQKILGPDVQLFIEEK